MSAVLSDVQRAACKKGLQEERSAHLAEIRRELLASDDERYVELAGSVHDLAEESVADLLGDLEVEEIDRLVHEVNEIEAALLRIAEGSYGVCMDCGQPVGYERLQAYPTAKRCRVCQSRYENSHAGARHPSL